jgi:methionine-rich copper-binding protein CopC
MTMLAQFKRLAIGLGSAFPSSASANCVSNTDQLAPVALGGLVLAAMLVAWGTSDARPLHISNSLPAAETVVDGRSAQYLIRFDGWVDHAASRIDITQHGKIVEVLVPNRESEPDMLIASAPALPAGRYELHWHARSVPDGDFSEGSIAFTVAR